MRVLNRPGLARSGGCCTERKINVVGSFFNINPKAQLCACMFVYVIAKSFTRTPAISVSIFQYAHKDNGKASLPAKCISTTE